MLCLVEVRLMSSVLARNAYGKSQVRLTKVTRHLDGHDLKEVDVTIQLEGDFAASFTHGDNTLVVPTDTMKNTVYILAKNHPLQDIESFGQALAQHFLSNYGHVTRATVNTAEQPWQRMVVNGRAHPHAFIHTGGERRICTVAATRHGLRVESGLEGLALLKTTDSAFTGFLRDRYTTLPDAADRIFATRLAAKWFYQTLPTDWSACYHLIRQTLLDVFAKHKSVAAQQTLYALGSAILEACPQIEEITMTLPNMH